MIVLFLLTRDSSVNPTSSLLQVIATALDSHALLRAQLWTGTIGIGEMPTKSGSTAPGTKHFPEPAGSDVADFADFVVS